MRAFLLSVVTAEPSREGLAAALQPHLWLEPSDLPQDHTRFALHGKPSSRRSQFHNRISSHKRSNLWKSWTSKQRSHQDVNNRFDFYCALKQWRRGACRTNYNTTNARLSKLGATPAAQVSGGQIPPPPSKTRKKGALVKLRHFSTSMPTSQQSSDDGSVVARSSSSCTQKRITCPLGANICRALSSYSCEKVAQSICSGEIVHRV